MGQALLVVQAPSSWRGVQALYVALAIAIPAALIAVAAVAYGGPAGALQAFARSGRAPTEAGPALWRLPACPPPAPAACPPPAPLECPPPESCTCDLPPDKAEAASSGPAAEGSSSAPCPAPAAGEGGSGAPAAAPAAAGLPDWRSSPFVAATDYKANLTARELEKGIVSYGESSRARRVMGKLLSGQAISVAWVGGSITRGEGASDALRKAYAQLVMEWVKTTFPKAEHRLINRGRGATPSSYFSLCCGKEVPADVDLVFLELSLNDGDDPKGGPLHMAHERLMRKLLRYPNRPAVVELVWLLRPYQRAPDGQAIFYYRFPGRGGANADDEKGVLAQYYRTPWLSARSLLWDGLQNASTDSPTQPHAGKFDYYWKLVEVVNGTAKWDGFHPGDIGHKWLADLLIHWWERVLDDVARHPLEREDEEEAQRPLPPPMYNGNYEAATDTTCMMGEDVKGAVVAHDPAFEWVNEGKHKDNPKWGWVSRQPGSSLHLALSTQVPGASGNVTVGIAHLKSYEHMGRFNVSCVEGCACDPITCEGHTKDETSQMNFAALVASPADVCKLKLTVLNDTTSGEHKVKLLGLLLSEAGNLLIYAGAKDLVVNYYTELVH